MSKNASIALARQLGRRLSLLAVLGTLLTGGLALGAVRAYRPEWRGVQVQYNTRAEEQGLSPVPLGLRQIWLPKLGVTDRCITCHLGMGDAKPLAEGGALFGAHPPVHHELSEIGCTLCHRGQGRATTAEAAHGSIEHWDQPLFPPGFEEAGCGPCHAEGVRLRLPAIVAEGRYLFELNGCSSCHTRDGRGGKVGPDLGAIALKGLSHDWQVRHLRSPTSVVKGSRMMSFGHLRDQDIEALIAYLDSLIGAPKLMRGKELAADLGCRGCHRINGIGGDQGPLLSDVVSKPASARDFAGVEGEGRGIVDWERAHLRDPQKVSHVSKMPGFHLDAEAEDALLTYVLSLPSPPLPLEALSHQTLGVRVSNQREFDESGEGLYRAFCSACHMQDGPKAMPSLKLTVPYIFNPDLLTVASDRYLRETLAAGRPGRDMPAWSTKDGGLTREEVGTLVAYLREAVPARPSAEAVAAATPNIKVGAFLFAGNCAGCHGRLAEGTVLAPSLANDEFLYLATGSKGFLYNTITLGRPDSGMPAHPQFDATQLASLMAFLTRRMPSASVQEKLRKTFESLTGVVSPFEYRAAGNAHYGKLLFDGMCRACHGEAGRGATGPGIGAPEFLNKVSDGFIAGTIALGRGGRAMRAFGALGMTPLTDREVGDIITYLRSVSADPDRPVGPQMQGNGARGKRLFRSYCAGCHGRDGEGRSGPALHNAGFLGAATDGFLLATMARGRSGTAMKGWLAGSNALEELPPTDLLDLLAYVRSFDSTTRRK